MPTLLNTTKPFRVYCGGGKIKIPVGETKVSEKNLEKLNTSAFFKMLLSNDHIRVTTVVKSKPIKESKKKMKFVDLDNDDND